MDNEYFDNEIEKEPDAGKEDVSQFGYVKKILVVDDILYVVKSIESILINAGYQVITAMTGNEAIQKYKKYLPDLITIDQKLPDMSGSKLIEQIKKHFSDTPPKIIIISANYNKEEIKSLLNLNVDNYLLKPFKKNKLIEVVKELIGDSA